MIHPLLCPKHCHLQSTETCFNKIPTTKIVNIPQLQVGIVSEFYRIPVYMLCHRTIYYRGSAVCTRFVQSIAFAFMAGVLFFIVYKHRWAGKRES